MNKFEWDWFVAWTCVTIIILGIVTAIYFGVQHTNEKYYAVMDKCIVAGGSFIPTSQGNSICLMGNKQ